MKCALCGKKIRNIKKAEKRLVSKNGKITYFCSERCNRIAQRFEEYDARIDRELGDEWSGVFAIYLDTLFQGREPRCENCINYIEGRCRGGEDPFECFFRKLKRAKEGGLKPNQMIVVSFDPPSIGVFEIIGTELALHVFLPFELRKECWERILREVMPYDYCS